jgi:stage IV sporulation protein B
MWVRDSSAGIGTLTFYDPSTGCFGGLGHPVCDSDTGEVLSVSEGSVGDIKITGCTKSVKGNPGQLTGEFATSASLGSIFRNCSEGLFGTLAANPSDENEVELAFRQEVHTGEAEILCSVDGGEAQRYSIVIEQVNLSENAEHDLVVRVTDSRLIEKTGGIVQGMSGSPIIQDGRLAGAVTHVFVDNPEMGYGIFAEDMYECETSVAEKFSDMAG